MESELDEWRRERLKALADKLGGKAALGKKLGQASGAFIGHMINGHRPITEKTILAIHALQEGKGWFVGGPGAPVQGTLLPEASQEADAREAAKRRVDEVLAMLGDLLHSMDDDGRDFAALALGKFARNPDAEQQRVRDILAASIKQTGGEPDPEPQGGKTRGKQKEASLKKSAGAAGLVLKLGGGQKQMFTVPMQPLRKAVDNRNATKREREWYEDLKAVPKASN